MVQRMTMKKAMKRSIFARNTLMETNPNHQGIACPASHAGRAQPATVCGMESPLNQGSGRLQPPKNRVTIMAEAEIIAAYSPRKKRAKRMPEYSVWYPPTSSVSASGKSNGSRFVSANAEIRKTRNEKAKQAPSKIPIIPSAKFGNASQPC